MSAEQPYTSPDLWISVLWDYNQSYNQIYSVTSLQRTTNDQFHVSRPSTFLRLPLSHTLMLYICYLHSGETVQRWTEEIWGNLVRGRRVSERSEYWVYSTVWSRDEASRCKEKARCLCLSQLYSSGQKCFQGYECVRKREPIWIILICTLVCKGGSVNKATFLSDSALCRS